MPELPEAETIARDLRRSTLGRRLLGAEVEHADVLTPPLTPAGLDERVRGRVLGDVGRRGKNVVLRLEPLEPPTGRDGGPGPVSSWVESPRGGGEPPAPPGVEAEVPLRLVVNLGMTGRLVPGRSPRARELRHVAVRFPLDEGALLYDDVRRFGRLELLGPAGWRRRDGELGLEPLSDAFTPGALHDLTRRSRTPIRNWLLDQRRVAGVGNIYAAEALFRAGIAPDRPASSLSRRRTARLREALRGVLEEAIAARGTTVSDYRDGEGEPGGFGPRLQVYGREGQPCPRCGRRVRRAVLTNRSVFFCSRCQR